MNIKKVVAVGIATAVVGTGLTFANTVEASAASCRIKYEGVASSRDYSPYLEVKIKKLGKKEKTYVLSRGESVSSCTGRIRMRLTSSWYEAGSASYRSPYYWDAITSQRQTYSKPWVYDSYLAHRAPR